MLINHRIYLIQWLILLTVAFTLFLIESIWIQLGLVFIYTNFIFLASHTLLPEKKQEMIYINLTCMIFGCLLYSAWQIRMNYAGFSLFLVNQILFHMGEMLHVAFYKFNLLSWNSFLINHSLAYNIAITFSVSEYFIEMFFLNKYHYIMMIGFLMTATGHIFRIGAFISAKQSFHHQVQSKKAPDHVLVTDGIYKWSRHPSYFGFFVFSLGQQIILMNPISFITYIPVLYKFFIKRIYFEEYYLYQFFGQAYVQYSTRTSILIPFIEYFLRF